MRSRKRILFDKTSGMLLPVLKALMMTTSKINFINLPPKEKLSLARITADLVKKFKVAKGDFSYFDMFDFWQSQGFNIIPNHFYQPIPDTSKIPLKTFRKKSEMKGININEKLQLNLIKKVFPKFQQEYNKISHTPDSQSHIYAFNNLAFDGVDGLVYYCLIRHLKPKKIIEIGSGWSTKIAAQAALINKTTSLISIEPYPQPILIKGFPGLKKVIKKDAQELPLDFFDQLGKNDILFIDSTHTVKTGGDVTFLFLEVLPRLRKGVVIHIHDIFLPFDYPKEWVLDEKRFWAEQYLLQSFLAFNSSFQVLYSNTYMGYKFRKAVQNAFPKSPFSSGGSIWIKKVK